MKSRFEPDLTSEARIPQDSRLVDPEAYDASEQQFAASLESPSPRFVVEDTSATEQPPTLTSAAEGPAQQTEQLADESPVQPDLISTPPNDSRHEDSWREEVAAKLNSYRSRRRTREPRYPSLRLKFEEPTWSASPRSEGSLAAAAEPEPVIEVERAQGETRAHPQTVPVETGKLLEFPRPIYAAPQPLDQLADPVLDRPRILEAPDVEPPPPALGGIHIEAEEEPVVERRPGFDLPLQPAPMIRRWLALGFDALIVLAAFAAFAAIFQKMTRAMLPWLQAVEVSGGLIAFFWTAYQYSMLVLTGSTPGLKVAKLELSRFDGRPAPRALRGCRVAALLLSGFSFGLGYAWAFLDEDRLCWHDRITRTYMAPKSENT